jgi:hypothetical protein
MYKDIHDKIIKTAKTRSSIKGYFESHHIIPRYANGSNDPSNLVDLTYREHCIIHFLLWKIYNNPEDQCAYKLMTGISSDRKQEIGRIIGAKHLKSGHIQALGQKNKESGWMLQIQSFETQSKGGKRGGQIAKETGQINTIATEESRTQGGKTASNLAKEKGQVQKLAKYKGTYVLIMPDGKEFQHAFEAAEYMNLPTDKISTRCKQGNCGFSRRPKTELELVNRWKNIE